MYRYQRLLDRAFPSARESAIFGGAAKPQAVYRRQNEYSLFDRAFPSSSPPAEVEKVFKNENLSPIHDDINVFSQKCSFLPKNNDGEES